MSVGIEQWCTTPAPRATAGPRQVTMWPAMSNRKATISQHVNDLNLKVQVENQLGYQLVNKVSAFRAKTILAPMRVGLFNSVYFHTFLLEQRINRARYTEPFSDLGDRDTQ